MSDTPAQTGLPPTADAAKALSAIRMAGFPLFLQAIGLGILVLYFYMRDYAFSLGFLAFGFQGDITIRALAGFALLGLFVFVVSLRVRAGKEAWVPLAVVCVAAYLPLYTLASFVTIWPILTPNATWDGLQIVVSSPGQMIWYCASVALVCVVAILAAYKRPFGTAIWPLALLTHLAVWLTIALSRGVPLIPDMGPGSWELPLHLLVHFVSVTCLTLAITGLPARRWWRENGQTLPV